MSLDKQNLFLISMITIATVPLGGMGIDISVPSLPNMTEYFQTHKSLIQMSVGMYILGMGIMQMVVGPISDSKGRRKLILMALTTYCITSSFIALSHKVVDLLLLRFIEGLAFGGTQVCLRAVAVDLFTGDKLYKVVNYMSTAWAISSIISPIIGAYLQTLFGWQASFYFLAIYSGLMVALIFIFVPETIKERNPFNLEHIIFNYKTILSNKNFLAGLICASSVYSLIIVFAVASPFLIQTVLKYSVTQFGSIALLTGIAFFCGTIMNRLLINISSSTKMNYSLFIMFIDILIMLLVSPFTNNIIFITVTNFILFYLIGILFPNSFSNNMKLFPKTPGIAGGIMGSSLLIFGTVFGSGLGTLLQGKTQMPIAFGYLCLFIMCVSSSLMYKTPRQSSH